MSGAAAIPSPPSDLVPRGRGRRFWKDVMQDNIPSPADLELLREACRLLDEIDVHREAFAKKPYVRGSQNQIREHPAGPALRQCRAELRRILDQLGIHAPDESGPGTSNEQVEGVTTLASRRAEKAANARWEGRGHA